jgi:hypothetical protein
LVESSKPLRVLFPFVVPFPGRVPLLLAITSAGLVLAIKNCQLTAR